MELTEAIQGRRSIRRFRPDPVPQEEIEEVIRLATLAPNTTNMQMWRFLAVRNKEVLNKMAQAIRQAFQEMAFWPEITHEDRKGIELSIRHGTFFTQAPVTFAVLLELYRSRTEKLLLSHGLAEIEVARRRGNSIYQSIGCALQNLALAAHARGYGTCCMTGPLVAVDALEKVLGVGPPWMLVSLVPMGVPDEAPHPPRRKGINEVLEFID